MRLKKGGEKWQEKKKSKPRVFSSFFPIKIKRLMWSTENPVFRNKVFCALPREVERKEDSARALSTVTAPYRMGHIGPRVPKVLAPKGRMRWCKSSSGLDAK